MCLSAIIGLGTAAVSASGASRAAKVQKESAQDQLALQERIYDETVERYEPYAGAGLSGTDAYMYEIGLGEAPEGYSGYKETPYYRFLMEQGVEQIQSSAAARGSRDSGATLEALERFRMGLASQEQNTYLNRLAALSSQGQAAAGGQAGAGQYFAQGGSTALANIGNAQAAGAIGVANAITGGVNAGLGAYGYLQELQQGG